MAGALSNAANHAQRNAGRIALAHCCTICIAEHAMNSISCPDDSWRLPWTGRRVRSPVEFHEHPFGKSHSVYIFDMAVGAQPLISPLESHFEDEPHAIQLRVVHKECSYCP